MTREIDLAQGHNSMPQTVIDERLNGNNRFIWHSWDYQNQPPPNDKGPNPPRFEIWFRINPADPIGNYIEASTPAGVVDASGDYLTFASVTTTVGSDTCEEVDIKFKKGTNNQPLAYNGRGIKYDIVMFDAGNQPVRLDPRVRPR